MGKSTKKSASKVEAVSVVPVTTKPMKKGKRGGAATIEKELVSAKKQKVVVKKLEKNVTKKKVDTSYSEDGSYSSESEQKPKAKLPTKNGKVRSSSEEESGGLEEDVGVQNKTLAAAAKNGHVAKKDNESSDGSESDDASGSDEEAAPVGKTPATVTINPTAKKDESSDGSESDDESSSDLDDNDSKIAPAQKATPAANQTAPIIKEGNSSEKSSEEGEESSEDEKEIPAKTPMTNATQNADVEMTDVTKMPKTPSTPKEQATGSKTLFMGNLSFSIEQADVENFFKPYGEVISVRFATRKEDDSFRGFGHVEFATPAEAHKALEELNGKDLLGRPVRLDLAKERGEGERGAYTPQSGGRDAHSFQKGAKSAGGQTVFIKGFDANGDEDETRSALEKHFGSCGEITRVSIPTDRETGNLRGIAYIDFTDSNGCTKALELSGSEVGGFELFVDESKPRTEGSGGRFGGRGRNGGRFDSGGGGRFGSRGRGGRGSDRGRGRGRSGGNRGRGRRD